MHIAAADTNLGVIVGEIFGHALRECGDQDALILRCAVADLCQKIVNLTLDRTDFYLRIDKSGGANNLFDDNAGRFGEFKGSGRSRNINSLTDACLEFLKPQWTVVHCRWQAEAIVDQVLLARAVAVPHAVELGHGDVRLIDEHEEITREII